MSCSYYRYSGGLFGGDYWCDKKDQRVDSDTYYKYCRNYNYDECPIYRQSSSSGCFITTVACEILGKDDHDVVLDDFRYFRDSVMQQDKRYYDTLKEYDVRGPMIADAILNDKDKVAMATGLYQNVLVPIHELLLLKDYDQAVEKYYLMTLMLIQYYGLKHVYNCLKDVDYV